MDTQRDYNDDDIEREQLYGYYNEDTPKFSCLMKTTKLVLDGIIVTSAVILTYGLIALF